MRRDPREWFFDGAVWKRRSLWGTDVDLTLDPHNVAQAASSAGTALANSELPPRLTRAMREGVKPAADALLASAIIASTAYVVGRMIR